MNERTSPVNTTEKQTKVFAVKKPMPIALTEEQCRKMCDKIGVSYIPGYEKRVLQYIVSNETTDRYGDIVRASGGRFENYMNNPVMYFSHNYSTPPIGNTLKVWVDRQAKNVQAWGLFLDDTVDKTGFSDLIFRFASSGFMKACSVGFMPLKAYCPQTEAEAAKMGLGTYGAEYLEWDMLEWSPCGIPANPDALQNAMKSIRGLSIEKRDIDTAAQFHLFDDVNLLDRFAELTLGKGVSVSVEVDVEIDKPEEPENETDPQEMPMPSTMTAPEPETPVTPAAPVVNLSLNLSDLVNVVGELKTALNEIITVQKTISEAVELIKKHNAETVERKSLYNQPEKIALFSKPQL